MPAAIHLCETHGYHEGDCPVCGADGTHVLNGARRKRLSKFCSGALRHFPDDAGIELDDAGWADWAELVAAVERKYDWVTGDHVAAVVATDPKGRFERDERAGTPVIRAAYGHSVAVDLDAGTTPVPETLYHGTAPRNVTAIQSEGLQPMGRQQVHLSESADAARGVGARHADDPVVFAVDAGGLVAAGQRVSKRGRATYTTDAVAPKYLRLLDP